MEARWNFFMTPDHAFTRDRRGKISFDLIVFSTVKENSGRSLFPPLSLSIRPLCDLVISQVVDNFIGDGYYALSDG